jgi:hypothetical protein
MATGRTVAKYTRVYAGGYDLSGYTRSIGPLSVEFDEASLVALTDGARGVLPNTGKIGVGTLNGIFDNTETSGLHVLMNGAGAMRTMLVAIGMRAAPAQGDPAFLGQFEQKSYTGGEDGGAVVATIPFEGWSARGASLLYGKPWGTLLHANAAATGENTAVGVDDYGVSPPSRGGYMVYQITAYGGTGSAVITVEDAATNADGSFATLTDGTNEMTSGSIAHTAMPCAGMVAISPTAAVLRYLRWQVALTDLTSLTFALAFVRG